VPELPEVETTRRGITPHLVGRTIEQVIVRERRLRWPVPRALDRGLTGARVTAVERRAKYLLVRTKRGTAIVHLGMSGSLRVLPADFPPFAHDHLDLLLDDGQLLRFTDPRRFGCWLWTREDPLRHALLAGLGPEPLDGAFNGQMLYERSRGRRGAVKSFIMDGHIVVGVGNIYASESLYRAGIHPARPAGRISRQRYDALATAIRAVLTYAISEGGTTLRDYTQSDGNPGYFALKLDVYDRAGEACRRCAGPVRSRVIGQRSSYYCPACQR
jgi:formamidopyrimidine-DNA glycosylase